MQWLQVKSLGQTPNAWDTLLGTWRKHLFSSWEKIHNDRILAVWPTFCFNHPYIYCHICMKCWGSFTQGNLYKYILYIHNYYYYTYSLHISAWCWLIRALEVQVCSTCVHAQAFCLERVHVASACCPLMLQAFTCVRYEVTKLKQQDIV